MGAIQISRKFRCSGCDTYFDSVKIYEEKHGLDAPPYEKRAVCPKCGGDDFNEFVFKIEKLEVVEQLLSAMMHLNIYRNDLSDIFGDRINNINFSEAIDILYELIIEMFDFISINMQKKLLNCTTRNDFERIIKYLKGGL